MTKLTEMCATERRRVARYHRVEAAVAKTEKEKIVGFTPRVAHLMWKETYHSAQAKLWEAAAAHAEATGNVRLQHS